MDPSDRGPLHNIEAEQSLLGAILINNKVLRQVDDFLEEEHFHDPVHRKIFAAIIDMVNDNKTADPIAVRAYFEKSGELREIGGGAYIVKLAFSVTTTSNPASDAKIISDLYERRQGSEDESLLPPTEQARTDRKLRHNIEAEQRLLGAILIDNKVLREVDDFLEGKHFHDPAHQRIFDAIKFMINTDDTADPVTVAAYFERHGWLGEIGGSAYIAKLALSVPTPTDARSNALIIQHLYVGQQMSELGSAISRGAGEQDKALLYPIKEAQNDLSELRESISPRSIGRRWATHGGTAVYDALEPKEHFWCRVHETTGLSTGLRDLDRKLDGLHGGELVVIAGTPSVGKTALATQIAINIRQMDRRFSRGPTSGMFFSPEVLFFSFGSLASPLAIRMVSQATGAPLAELSHGGLADRNGDLDKTGSIGDINRIRAEDALWFVEVPSLTLTMIKKRAKLCGDELALIIIDNLRLIDVGCGEREYPFDMRAAALGLKRLAMELNVAVLALAPIRQVNEGYEDHRPWSSDLYSVPLIEHADTMMFLHREACGLSRREPIRRSDESGREFNDRHERWRNRLRDAGNVTELFIDRQRHGPTGLVRLNFDPATTRFTDYVETETA